MRHSLIIALLSLFFTSCEKDEFTTIPSEGYFVIETDPDGETYIRSIADAPNEGYKNYLCRTANGLVMEIADPSCGDTVKRMNITSILFVSGRNENGSAIYKSYSPIDGDEIILNEVYYDERKKFHETTLQIVTLSANDYTR